MKQSALARLLKVSPQTMSSYENGPNKVPARRVPQIADALGVTICELFGRQHEASAAVETGSGKTALLIERLVHALERNPDLLEVNVYTQGSYRPDTGPLHKVDVLPKPDLLTKPGRRRRVETLAEVVQEISATMAPADHEFAEAFAEWFQGFRARLLAEENEPLPNRTLTE